MAEFERWENALVVAKSSSCARTMDILAFHDDVLRVILRYHLPTLVSKHNTLVLNKLLFVCR